MTLGECPNPEFFVLGQITAELKIAAPDCARRIAVIMRAYYGDRYRRSTDPTLTDVYVEETHRMDQAVNELTKGAKHDL